MDICIDCISRQVCVKLLPQEGEWGPSVWAEIRDVTCPKRPKILHHVLDRLILVASYSVPKCSLLRAFIPVTVLFLNRQRSWLRELFSDFPKHALKSLIKV